MGHVQKSIRLPRFVVTSAVTLVLAVLLPMVSVGANPPPVQSYYIPLPEEELLDTFNAINSDAQSPINSLISIAIGADSTIIYYDHWEDGYEADVTTPADTSTAIWGDGVAANGCVPNKGGVDIDPCTDGDDLLENGDTIVLRNDVPLPRDPAQIWYDGRDLIAPTFPIAVTRGAYPAGAGSLLAGAVEVFDDSAWGTEYRAPVGEDTGSGTSAFELVDLYILTGSNDTGISVNGTPQTTLDQGESLVISVNEGDQITTTNPVQVDLLAGDIGSTYEMRWYTLPPLLDWFNDYYSPVGNNGDGDVSVWLHNPTDQSFDVTLRRISGDTTISLGPGETDQSPDIPSEQGARFFTTNPAHVFFALAQVDSDGSGQIYDWGFPLVPANKLSPQALIGLGRGCTDDCSPGNNGESRSLVWVTPVTGPTDIYVDLDGSGISCSNDPAGDADLTFSNVIPLQSIKIRDAGDEDMTGARVLTCDGTNIAVAWGQDPAESFSGDEEALDMGTTIPPLPNISLNKSAQLLDDADNDGDFSPGDTIRYAIRVSNNSSADLPTGSFSIADDLPGNVTYVAGSTQYDDGSSVTPLPDNAGAFPLAGTGIASISPLPANSAHTLFFDVVIVEAPDACLVPVTNTATVRRPAFSGTPLIDSVATDLACAPAIDLEKEVSVDDQTTWSDADSPPGPATVGGSDVYFRFTITNTGNVSLEDLTLVDSDFSLTTCALPGSLAPGADYTCTFGPVSAITGQHENTAAASGTGDGTTVEDKDSAHYNTPIPGSIGDRVWYDLSGDSVQDGNEVGINGVTVGIYDSTCAARSEPPVASQVTAGDGDYLFASLLPGDYCVVVDESTLPAPGYLETTGLNPLDVSLTSGQDYLDADFGYVATVCLPTIDFETDAAGNPLPAGTILDDEWAAWGIQITSSDPVNNPPMLFDSANPTGNDDDLGAPNEDFGGPGIGAGGGAGTPGENSQTLDNILIISTDADPNDPDDHGSGGILSFSFTQPLRLDQVEILDVDDDEAGGTVTAYSDTAGTVPIASGEMLGLGSNSLQVVPVNATDARRLDIAFPSSGGVPAIVFCGTPPELYSLGDFIWEDANADGVQDPGEPGIPGVALELYVSSDLTTLVETTSTDANGVYTFTNLPNGDYTVVLADSNFAANGPLDGFNFSPTDQTDDDLDSDFDSSSRQASGTITGADNLTVDGGFFRPGNLRIRIGPPAAVNLVDDSHTFTVTVEQNLSTGWTGLTGAQPVLSFDPAPSTVSDNACSTGTDAVGQCTITINSDVTGIFTATATVTETVTGQTFTRVTGGSANEALGGSGPATKLYIDVRLRLAPPEATNRVGDSHTFTATVEVDYGDGSGFVPVPAGETVEFDLVSGPGTLSTPTCTTDANGQCTVTLDSLTTGESTVSATWSGTITTAQGSTSATASDSGIKRWVDARITITPLSATNLVTDSHTFTVTVEIQDQSGWQPAPDGTAVSFDLRNNTASAFFVGGVDTCDTLGGLCTIVINSAQSGSVDVHAIARVTVQGLAITVETDGIGQNSPDGTKTYVDPVPYSLTKALITDEPVSLAPNQNALQFEIRITNLGIYTLTTVPLTDTYNTEYLNFTGSNVEPDSPTALLDDDGTLSWADLTQPAPNGFGQDLAPGESFTILLDFDGVKDTTLIQGEPACDTIEETCNTTGVTGAFFDPDGPGGEPPLGPLPPQEAHDDVKILSPTAVGVSSAWLALSPDGVDLHWETTDESNLQRFEVWRIQDGQRQLAHNVIADRSGQPTGTLYEWTDDGAVPGQWYEYELTLYDLSNMPLATVELGRIYTEVRQILLPLVAR